MTDENEQLYRDYWCGVDAKDAVSLLIVDFWLIIESQ